MQILARTGATAHVVVQRDAVCTGMETEGTHRARSAGRKPRVRLDANNLFMAMAAVEKEAGKLAGDLQQKSKAHTE